MHNYSLLSEVCSVGAEHCRVLVSALTPKTRWGRPDLVDQLKTFANSVKGNSCLVFCMEGAHRPTLASPCIVSGVTATAWQLASDHVEASALSSHVC